MFRKVFLLTATLTLIGCVNPVSSSCKDAQAYRHPDSVQPPTNSQCDATDAAMYVMAATLKTIDEKEPKSTKKSETATKCQNLVGEAYKKCQAQKQKKYDPLDEFEKN